MFRASTGPKGPASPHFPTYLLPSLKIPFIRRRQSSSATTTSSNADVPSLSSSPVSTASTEDHDFFPSLSPPNDTGTAQNTYSIPDHAQDHPDKPAITTKKRQQPPPAPPRDPNSDRLARALPDVLRCNTCGTDVAYGLQVVSKGFTGRHGRALLVSAPPSPPPPASPTPLGHHALARDGANLINVVVGRPESRNLVTGAHVVADISCATCGVKIGWKYVDAREAAQKYKVGKFILETERVVLFRSWEDVRPGEEDGEEAAAGFGARGDYYSSSAPAGMFWSGRKASGRPAADRKGSCSSGGAGGFVAEEEEEDESGSAGENAEDEIVFDSDDEDECEDIFAGVWDAATVARRRGSRVGGGSNRTKKRPGRGADGGR